jgi:integrase
MSVLKRKDGGWRIDIVVRRGKSSVRIKRAAKGARNRGEALEMERKLRRELETRADPSAKAPLFSEFAEDFLEKYALTNNKPSEYKSKKDILHLHLVPWFSGLRMDEIGDEDVEAYKGAKIKLGLSAKTVNNHGAVFSRMYRVALEWKRMSFAPQWKPLKLPVQEFDFLTFDEARALVRHAGAWAEMIVVALNTGMRAGELLGLRGVDVIAGKLLVRQALVRGKVTTPKSHKPREIPLNLRATSAIGELAPRPEQYVFRNIDGSGPLTYAMIRKPLWRACKHAGLRRIGWHVLRHTFASHLAMLGVPLKTIQELLGHSDIRMTMRYAHLSPVAKVEAVAKLDAVGATGPSGTTDHMAEPQGPTTDRKDSE